MTEFGDAEVHGVLGATTSGAIRRSSRQRRRAVGSLPVRSRFDGGRSHDAFWFNEWNKVMCANIGVNGGVPIDETTPTILRRSWAASGHAVRVLRPRLA